MVLFQDQELIISSTVGYLVNILSLIDFITVEKAIIKFYLYNRKRYDSATNHFRWAWPECGA